MLEIKKTDFEEYKRKVNALSLFEGEEILWSTQRAEDYLAKQDHQYQHPDGDGEDKEYDTAR